MAAEEYKVVYEDGVISGTQVKVDYPEHGLGCFIASACDQFATNVFQECPYTKQSYTFAQHKRQSLTLAANLKTHFNVQQGDVVLTCMRNSFENTLPITAALNLAAISSALDPTLSLLDCAHLISVSEPKVIIVDEESIPLICASLKTANKSAGLVINEFKQKSVDLGGIDKAVASKCTTLQQMLAEDEKTKLFQPVRVTNMDIMAAIVFSSGTTGLPKGICISQRALLRGSMLAFDLLCKPKVYTHITTMYWISGLVLYCSQFLQGGTRIALRSFDAELLCKCVATYKINTALLGNAYALDFMSVQNFTDKHDISSLGVVVLGGTMLSLSKLKALVESYPNIDFINAYGMSEMAGPVTAFIGPYYSRIKDQLGSIGMPMSGIQIKIVDQETGKTLGPTQEGEIRMRTEWKQLGYYNNNDNPLDEQGFIKSGDLGFYDKDLNLFFTGRTKDMFKYRSWHIVPASIENILATHPAVDEAVVFGIPSEVDEFIPSAAVVLRNTHLRTEPKDIADFVAAHVAERQQLIGGVHIIDKIPKTVTGKINRLKLKEMMLKRIAQ